jgi:hypothetical protein
LTLQRVWQLQGELDAREGRTGDRASRADDAIPAFESAALAALLLADSRELAIRNTLGVLGGGGGYGAALRHCDAALASAPRGTPDEAVILNGLGAR